jgi:hypothetical protein
MKCWRKLVAGSTVEVIRARVETKIFVFVFSRKFRENLFALFAKKAYESYENNKILRKFAHFCFSRKWKPFSFQPL